MSNVENFEKYLYEVGLSKSSITKYNFVISEFHEWINNNKTIEITKAVVADYKDYLKSTCKSITTCNNKLAVINKYLIYLGLGDFKVDYFKVAEKQYLDENRCINKSDFDKLLKVADEEMKMILHTFAGTGIRVSELKYFTYVSVDVGVIHIDNKGKVRDVVLPRKLRQRLLDYCRNKNIKSGCIFTGRSKKNNINNKKSSNSHNNEDNKKPYDRCTIWAKLKRLAKLAGVVLTKAFPHALRHFYARVHYELYKDIETLKTILGHTNIATTLIYLRQTLSEYARKVDVRLLE